MQMQIELRKYPQPLHIPAKNLENEQSPGYGPRLLMRHYSLQNRSPGAQDWQSSYQNSTGTNACREQKTIFTASENYVIPSRGASYNTYKMLFTSTKSTQIVDSHGPIMRILHHLVPPCHEDHHCLRSRH